MYRWQSADGQWHYTDHPPEDGVAYEIQAVPTISNTMSVDAMVELEKAGLKAGKVSGEGELSE